jgi:PAS domain S-box-containing protein
VPGKAEFEMINPTMTVAMKTSIPTILPKGLEEVIFKSLRVPLSVIDNQFRCLWLNQEMAGIYQTRPDQAAGKICYQIISEQTEPCHDCPVAAVQKSRQRENSQKYKDFSNGVRKYGEVSAFPIFDPQQSVVATVVMITDVTHKMMVDMDSAYQILSRLSSPAQESSSQTSNTLNRKPIKKGGGQAHFGNASLTRRETQVLQLMAEGYSNPQIAVRLAISPHTVKSHVIHIFNKLGVNDRIQAAVAATRQGIVE